MKTRLLKLIIPAIFILIFIFFLSYKLIGNDQKKINKPNVVLIVADDLGWADIEPYGTKFYETPNIKRLASEGVRFTDHYAASPVCSPSRAALLTGKHPVSYNITDWLPGRKIISGTQLSDKLITPDISQGLPLSERTIAEILKLNGYRTGCIGKWHLGDGYFSPFSQGFDIYDSGNPYGSPPDYYYPNYDEKPNIIVQKLKSWLGLNNKDELEEPYLTDRLTNSVVQFISENTRAPFFLYIPHYTPHIPLTAKKDLLNKYLNKRKSNFNGKQDNPYYAAMVESLDQSIGSILKALDQNKISENTIVIFVSDNGGLSVYEEGFDHTPATSNFPLRGGKGCLYEGGIRTPLIIKWPGKIKPNTINSVPVSSMDLLPFLATFCSVKEKLNGIDGIDIMPIVSGINEVNRAIYFHYPHYSNQGGKPSGAIRKGDFKLIENFEDNRIELYNLSEDLGEQNDLSKKMPDKRDELLALLKNWRQQKKAKMPVLIRR